MEEIKPIQNGEVKQESDEKKSEVPKEEVQEKKPLVETIKDLKKFKEDVTSGNIKIKKVRIPRKAKVGRKKLREGYIGILKIEENRNISLEKQKISGSSFKTKDGLYHSTNGKELLFWQGKYPVIVQCSWKNNPNIFDPLSEKNETYGQPYIKAKMLADTIKVKSKASGSIIIWILIAGAALFGINYLMGGKLFG